MTEVVSEDGSKMETNLPAEAVADLQAKPAEPAAEPAKPVEAQKPPVEAPKTEEPKVEKPAEPEAPQQRGKKASPIQNLLNQRHDLETQLETERAAKVELEAKIAELSKRPVTQATDNKLKALAEKYQLPEEFVQEMVDAARDGMKPELPKEVADLVAKQQEAAVIEAEQQGFDNDYTRLQGTLKDETLKNPEVKDKLMELAYSTEKAPDGEPYFQKPLYELYMNFVKPEVEPGTVSAERSRGGSKAGGKVTDFAAIKADPAAMEEFARTSTPEQFDAFQKWDRETSGDTPLRKPQTV